MKNIFIKHEMKEIITKEILEIINENPEFRSHDFKLIKYYSQNKNEIINKIIKNYINSMNSNFTYEQLELVTILMVEEIIAKGEYKKALLPNDYEELREYIIGIFDKKRVELELDYYDFQNYLEEDRLKYILIQEYNIDLNDKEILECYKSAINHFQYLNYCKIEKDKKKYHKELKEKRTIMGLRPFTFLIAAIIAFFEAFGDNSKK